MTTTSNNNATVNNAAAREAEGMFTKAKNAINSFIKSAPDKFAKLTKGLENISGMSDEEATRTLENFYTSSAEEMDKYIKVAKSIPSYADTLAVKDMEGLKNAFHTLAAEVKDAEKAGDKVRKAIKLVGTLFFIIGRKIVQVGVAAAKKLLVVGIRIAAIAGGFVITVITKGIKAVKKAFRFGKAYKTVKAEEKARKNAPLTVDDLEEEDFKVNC